MSHSERAEQGPTDQESAEHTSRAAHEAQRRTEADRRAVRALRGAAGGSAAATVAFFALPLVSVPFVGSVTGARAASLVRDVDDQSPVPQALWLWLLLSVAGAAIAVLAAQASTTDTARRTAGFAVLGTSTITTMIPVLLAIKASGLVEGLGMGGVDVGGLLAAGFWVGLFGSLAALVSAVMVLAATKDS